MLRNLLFILICVSFGAGIACTSTETLNTNANLNSNIPANLPPGFSTNAVPPSGNSTPGIPDPNNMNANNVPKGATPTPGIPDPKDIGKPMQKGTTPTPGIPDPETLKRQANTIIKDANLVNNPPNTNKSKVEKPENDRKRPTPPGK
jgi:hypothetical protein